MLVNDTFFELEKGSLLIVRPEHFYQKTNTIVIALSQRFSDSRVMATD